MSQFDVVIIGAGPAGLAAAVTLAQTKLSVLVLDEQAAPGGQVHRGIATRKIASVDDRDGMKLAASFMECGAAYWPRSAVWQIEPMTPQTDAGDAGDVNATPDPAGFRIFLTRTTEERENRNETLQITARRLILATGAMERPVPIPGWTMPGVMSVGAAQILLKTGGNVPSGKVVIAGQGPLVLLYAAQLIKAGVKPHAILDTTPKGAIRRALPYLVSAMGNLPQLIRGLGYMITIARARVPVRRDVEAVEATGTDQLETVSYRRKKKWTKDKWYVLEADLLLLHEGVVPHTHLAMSIGAKHIWDNAQLCWRPLLGSEGQSSVAGMSITGDGAGIGGWRVAVADGALVAQTVALSLGTSAITDQFCISLRRERDMHASLRPFLDALYKPHAALLAPANDVIICRCEEKSAGEVRAAIAQGCLGPNQVKSFTRCGMGPCQGRQCALTLTTLIAQERGITADEVGYLRIRPPLKPLSLGELAALCEPEHQDFQADETPA